MEPSFWETIESLIKVEEAELFDIESPKRAGGVVKVFIHRPQAAENSDRQSGINISDCARVSKRILDLAEIDRFLPGDTRLEVSSPGINRKLRLPRHFSGAIGERVKIAFIAESGERRTVRGILSAFDGEQLTVNDESSGSGIHFALRDVKEARVDFPFEAKRLRD